MNTNDSIQCEDEDCRNAATGILFITGSDSGANGTFLCDTHGGPAATQDGEDLAWEAF